MAKVLAEIFGGVAVIILIVLVIGVFLVYPMWYLITIGHIPNWAGAMYVFGLIGSGIGLIFGSSVK